MQIYGVDRSSTEVLSSMSDQLKNDLKSIGLAGSNVLSNESHKTAH